MNSTPGLIRADDLQVRPIRRDKARLAALALLSLVVVAAMFAWQGRIGFDLADEGFLWYGTQRVMLGEVPLRDFMSYDPGRYYWSAAVMALMGDSGIVSLRIAAALFQVLGLFLALRMLARQLPRIDPLWIALAAGTLTVWMFPRHKLFDVTLSIALIAALAHLIAQPSARRYWLTGMWVGLAAAFGRNHGVYGAIGSLCAIVYLAGWRKPGGLLPALSWWAVGVRAGYLPVLLAVILAPGFGAAFFDGIRFLFEVKATNLPTPVPWPWLTPVGSQPWPESMRGILVGLFFLATLVFGVLGIAWAVQARRRAAELSPVLLAAIFLALPYAHFAFSRADLGHLAQGIFPLLIGTLCIFSVRPTLVRIAGTAALLLASLLVMLPLHPGWQSSRAGGWSEAQVGTDRLALDPDTKANAQLLNGMVEKYAAGQGTFIAAPHWPGAYAMFRRKSPMWEIYALFPRSAAFQMAEINRIDAAGPRFAVLTDVALDGREELRFRNTHPLEYRYVLEHYTALERPAGPAWAGVRRDRQDAK